jgi:hypothetical protein
MRNNGTLIVKVIFQVTRRGENCSHYALRHAIRGVLHPYVTARISAVALEFNYRGMCCYLAAIRLTIRCWRLQIKTFHYKGWRIRG